MRNAEVKLKEAERKNNTVPEMFPNSLWEILCCQVIF
jgi:hypothetical protein